MIYKLFESSLIESIHSYESFPKHFGTDAFPSNVVTFPYADELVTYKKGAFGKFMEIESSITNYIDTNSFGLESYSHRTWNPHWDMDTWYRIQSTAKLWTSPQNNQMVAQFYKKNGLNLYYEKKPILYARSGHKRYNTLNEYLKNPLHNNKAIFRHFICINTTSKTIDNILDSYYKTLVDELLKENGNFYYHLKNSSKIKTIFSRIQNCFYDFPASGGNIEIGLVYSSIIIKSRGLIWAHSNFSDLGWKDLSSDYELFWLGYSILEEIVEILKNCDIIINIDTFRLNYHEGSINLMLPIPRQNITPPELEPW